MNLQLPPRYRFKCDFLRNLPANKKVGKYSVNVSWWLFLLERNAVSPQQQRDFPIHANFIGTVWSFLFLVLVSLPWNFLSPANVLLHGENKNTTWQKNEIDQPRKAHFQEHVQAIREINKLNKNKAVLFLLSAITDQLPWWSVPRCCSPKLLHTFPQPCNIFFSLKPSNHIGRSSHKKLETTLWNHWLPNQESVCASLRVKIQTLVWPEKMCWRDLENVPRLRNYTFIKMLLLVPAERIQILRPLFCHFSGTEKK